MAGSFLGREKAARLDGPAQLRGRTHRLVLVTGGGTPAGRAGGCAEFCRSVRPASPQSANSTHSAQLARCPIDRNSRPQWRQQHPQSTLPSEHPVRSGRAEGRRSPVGAFAGLITTGVGSSSPILLCSTGLCPSGCKRPSGTPGICRPGGTCLRPSQDPGLQHAQARQLHQPLQSACRPVYELVLATGSGHRGRFRFNCRHAPGLGAGPGRTPAPRRRAPTHPRIPLAPPPVLQRYLQEHGEVHLSALGIAVSGAVTVAEILKNRKLAVEKKLGTSLEVLGDEQRWAARAGRRPGAAAGRGAAAAAALAPVLRSPAVPYSARWAC